MTTPGNQADPLEERKKILSQHIGKAEKQKAGKPENQQNDIQQLVKVTFRLPDQLLARLERVQLALKQSKLDQPKDQRKVLLQDVFTQAVDDYVQKMEKKFKL